VDFGDGNNGGSNNGSVAITYLMTIAGGDAAILQRPLYNYLSSKLIYYNIHDAKKCFSSNRCVVNLYEWDYLIDYI